MSAPYYADEQVTLLLGDALDLLATLHTSSADAIITDPPYIVPSSTGKQGGSPTDTANAARWYEQWLSECGRILDPAGSMWLTANWRLIPVLMRAAYAAGLDVTDMAVWDKQWIGTGGSRGLRSRHEMCLLLPGPKWHNPDRSAANVWPIKGIVTKKPSGHPAEKPLPLLRHIVRLSNITAPGLILDPFAGSGTTLLAAAEAGHHAVGIEADPRWADVCTRRLAARQTAFPEVPS